MIIVTGGAGFIGSNIIKGLNALGEERIVVVDNLENSEKIRNLSSLRIYDYVDKREFIRNIESFRGVNVIFHQGACTNTMENNGRYLMENNYDYSKRLVNFCMESGISPVQIVGLRYFNVYGPGEWHKGRMASVIYQFYNQVKSEGKIRLFEGSERFKRDFIYIRDVVKGKKLFRSCGDSK